MGCPKANEIAALVDGRLAATAIATLQEHLDACVSCFALVAELARGDDVASTVAGARTGDAAAADGAAAGWRATRQLEEYRLIRPIGRGSGGQVWLAHDALLDREVAIKFLSAATHPRARERFRNEVRAVARLNHPNVVTVFRVGEVDGQPYLVSELVRGNSLDAGPRPLPWTRVREIAVGLARGLAAAHRAGIIHRDIKPGNVVVADGGDIKLLDFGLAKLHDNELDERAPERHAAAAAPSVTATGHLLGTPLYMAPEAWQASAPSFAMDIYSLGALLHELCAGAPPHTGATLGELRRAVLEDVVRPLAERVPGIDARFAAVIDRCLARDPAARYRTGEDLRAALDAAGTPRRADRRGGILAIAAVGLAVIALATVGLARGPAERPPRAATVPPALPQRCSSDRWCWDATWVGALNAVWGANAADVWIVGERGVARHFVGNAWADVDVGTVADLYHVGGTAPDDVWIVGGWGTILHWDGHAWRELPSGTHDALYGLWAAARDDAWIVGERGLMLHWDGHAWRTQPSPTTETLFAVAGTSASDVWVTGFAAALHWDGHAWTASDVHAHELIQPIHLASPRDVWISGFHSVIRHYDGNAWRTIAVPDVASASAREREDYPFNSGAGIGTDELWLLAKRGGFLHRVGGTWTRVEQGTQRELFAMHAFARDDAWAVGAAGAIVHWDGHAWQQVGAEQSFRSTHGLYATGPGNVWAVGLRTDDAGRARGAARHFDGRRWRDIVLPDVPALAAVAGDRNEIWAVGDAGTIIHARAGTVSLVPSATMANLRALWIDAPGSAWAVGDEGTILRYRSGAWHPIPGTRGSLAGIWGSGPGDAWAVGSQGMLRLQGETWTPVDAGTSEPLAAIWGAAADDVWAVGAHGTTVHWNGRAWSTVYSDFDQPLAAISGSRSDDVWAVANSDQGGPSIIHWNGAFWTRIERTTHAPLAAICAVGLDEAWAAGPWSSFLHHVPAS